MMDNSDSFKSSVFGKFEAWITNKLNVRHDHEINT